MTTIRVFASKDYDVIVGGGLLECVGELSRAAVGVCTAAVVSDDIVYPLYGARVEQSLREAGFRVIHCVIPHGEQHKNLATYGAVLNELCAARLTRSDIVVALGGGVVGDLAGFAAATYQRGIRFIQIPTTLLAMVDSSVGGKTAVDLDAGKNQVGAFCQPSLVVCDPEVLSTLPEAEYRCGCAEIIKYAVLGSEPFFEELARTPVREQLMHVIETCVTMKRDIVREDEFDRGLRRTLNLGHSIGHAVEACSDFSILHGEAVAIGMAVIAKAAAQKGFCAPDVPERLLAVLERYHLPCSTDYSLEELFEAAMADKKMEGGTMHLIVPEKIGACRIEAIPAAALRDWMRAGGL